MAVEIHTEQMEYARRALAGIRNGAENAAMRAINRAVTAAKTAAAREASQQYTVKQRSVRETLKTSRATRNSLRSRLTSRGKAVPLIDFSVRPKRPMHDGRRRLMVQVMRQQAAKSLPGAFVARSTKTGRLAVFMRATRDRYPIRELYGPAIPNMLGQRDVRDVIETRAGAMLADRLDHEIERIIQRRG